MKLALLTATIIAISSTSALPAQVHPAQEASIYQAPSEKSQDGKLKPGYGIPFQPTATPDFQVQAEQKRRQEQYQKENMPRLTELTALAIKDSWLGVKLYREYKRKAQQKTFLPAPNFRVTTDILDNLPIRYSLDARSYLMDSKSPQEFMARQGWANEDLLRKQAIAAYGTAGVFTRLLVSALDPPKLVIIILVLWLAYRRVIKGYRLSLKAYEGFRQAMHG